MIRFELENTIEADIDKVCDMDSRYYDFHQPTEAVEDEGQIERPASSASQNSRHQQVCSLAQLFLVDFTGSTNLILYSVATAGAPICQMNLAASKAF